jgi:hypothetical protein
MTISLEKNKCGDSEGMTNICALMDGISAIGMPGRSLMQCIAQIPLHMDVELLPRKAFLCVISMSR